MDINKEIYSLIAREGGFVNHQADKGGATKYGITQDTLTLYLGKTCSAEDVEAISKQTAREIYYTKYYIRPGINTLPELIQPILLDMSVNMGDRAAVKLLQIALDNCGFGPLKIDGRIGQVTAAASQQAVEQMGNGLIKTLVSRRVIFYESLVRQNETQRAFLSGWINRAESFLPEAMV